MNLYTLITNLKRDYPESAISKDISLIYDLNEYNQINLPYYNIDKIIAEYEKYPVPTISCGIMTFNEERCIYRCMNSIYNEFDEIILLDSFSTDNTINIVQSNFPVVKIFYEKWKKDFSYTRNKLIEYCNSDWIIFIDSDNVYSKDNKGKIKRIIKLIDFLDIKCVISPIIEEHNGHVYTDNRKIIKNNGFLFKGKIHEEPFHINGDLPLNISADILVFHDGYDDKFVNQTDKYKRNLQSTKDMILTEPNNPKWLYFYARELQQENVDLNELAIILEKALILFESSKYKRYLPETIILYCQVLLKTNSFEKLIIQIEYLEKLMPNCLDVDYFRAIIIFIQTNIKLGKVANILSNSIQEKSQFSIINSTNDHIHSLLSQIYLSLNQPNSSIEHFNKIGFEKTKLKTQETYDILYKYLKEVVR